MGSTDFARNAVGGGLGGSLLGAQRITPRTSAELAAILESLEKAVDRVNGQGRVLASAIARTSGVHDLESGEEARTRPDGLIPQIAALCDDLHRAIDQMQSPIDHATKL